MLKLIKELFYTTSGTIFPPITAALTVLLYPQIKKECILIWKLKLFVKLHCIITIYKFIHVGIYVSVRYNTCYCFKWDKHVVSGNSNIFFLFKKPVVKNFCDLSKILNFEKL